MRLISPQRQDAVTANFTGGGIPRIGSPVAWVSGEDNTVQLADAMDADRFPAVGLISRVNSSTQVEFRYMGTIRAHADTIGPEGVTLAAGQPVFLSPRGMGLLEVGGDGSTGEDPVFGEWESQQLGTIRSADGALLINIGTPFAIS